MLPKILIGLMFLCTQVGYAVQTVSMENNEHASLDISNSGVTRIVVEQDRIRSLHGTEGEFQIQHDKLSGELFLKPLNAESNTVFIGTEKGRNFTLTLSPKAIQPDTIQIQATSKALRQGDIVMPKKAAQYLFKVAENE